MATTTTTQWAIGTWATKTTLSYVPINTPINNKFLDAYGKLTSGAPNVQLAIVRRPYKKYVDDDSGIAYIMYNDDSSNSVPIIKITEG